MDYVPLCLKGRLFSLRVLVMFLLCSFLAGCPNSRAFVRTNIYVRLLVHYVEMCTCPFIFICGCACGLSEYLYD